MTGITPLIIVMCLKATFVLLAAGLQKPGPKLKAKAKSANYYANAGLFKVKLEN